MIRVSTTTIESFRRVVATEYGDEEELVASIKGEPWRPTWKMDAGKAWQECLCGMDRSSHKFSFDESAIADARRHIGPGLSEVKATRVFDIGVPVNVVAQVDHIHGLDIQENKAKFSSPDQRDYEQVLQWRFYLLIHQAASVRYNLFAFRDPDDAGFCLLREVVSFRFFPYFGLESECRKWVSRFVDWADSRKLLDYLKREATTPELEAA